MTKQQQYNKKYYQKHKKEILLCQAKWKLKHKKQWEEYRKKYDFEHKKIYSNRAKMGKRSVIKYCRNLRNNKCEICGNTTNLDFHHKDPTNKKFNITERRFLTGILFDELERCILICRSCHLKLHRDKNNEKIACVSY